MSVLIVFRQKHDVYKKTATKMQFLKRKRRIYLIGQVCMMIGAFGRSPQLQIPLFLTWFWWFLTVWLFSSGYSSFFYHHSTFLGAEQGRCWFIEEAPLDVLCLKLNESSYFYLFLIPYAEADSTLWYFHGLLRLCQQFSGPNTFVPSTCSPSEKPF